MSTSDRSCLVSPSRGGLLSKATLRPTVKLVECSDMQCTVYSTVDVGLVG